MRCAPPTEEYFSQKRAEKISATFITHVGEKYLRVHISPMSTAFIPHKPARPTAATFRIFAMQLFL